VQGYQSQDLQNLGRFSKIWVDLNKIMDKKYIPIGKTSKMIGVSIKTLRRWDKSGKFTAVRHSSSGNRYYLLRDIELLLNDPVAIARQWAFNSSPKPPHADFHCRTRDVFQARLESFQHKLTKSTNDQVSSLITAIAGEIGNNSFDHNLGNWPDILGIFFSPTPNKKIVLVDRGQGILATLKKVDPTLKTHAQALTVAFTKRISARSSEARGNGLKFVRSIVTSHPFKLSFQTGNALLELSEKENLVNVKIVQETVRGCFAIIKY
jgi:ribosomal protein L28